MTSRVHPEQVFANEFDAPDLPAGSSKVARVGVALETFIKWITEVPAAVLLVVEVVLLLTNVTCRYALHDPLIWGDELASILFIWLSMLGAVIALRRGEHMRLTMFLAKMPQSRRIFAETLGNFIVMTFVLLLVQIVLGHLITEGKADGWIGVHVPLAFVIVALAVSMSIRGAQVRRRSA